MSGGLQCLVTGVCSYRSQTTGVIQPVFNAIHAQESQDMDATPINFYGDDFYKQLSDSSLSSALKYTDLLSPIFKPKTVVDVVPRQRMLDLRA
jgi:hypothetical protein